MLIHNPTMTFSYLINRYELVIGTCGHSPLELTIICDNAKCT